MPHTRNANLERVWGNLYGLDITVCGPSDPCDSINSKGACGMLFEIVALDPEDLSEQVIVAHQGAPTGGATVALHRDGVYYLGTFAGDRLGIVYLSR